MDEKTLFFDQLGCRGNAWCPQQAYYGEVIGTPAGYFKVDEHFLENQENHSELLPGGVCRDHNVLELRGGRSVVPVIDLSDLLVEPLTIEWAG